VSGEPLLDRLARRLTRREAIRAGAITAAAATLPVSLWRAAPASALPDNSACLKGCQWFAVQTCSNNLQQCADQFNNNYDRLLLGLGASSLSFGLLAIAGGDVVVQFLDRQVKACEDQAMLQAKADMWNCISKDACNGFNPNQKGGPCATCTAALGSCCSDPLVAQGYSCCSMGCACGTDTGACHGSVTPC
jgi:hypothetical protein